jgi:glycine cleavage system H protein
VLDNRPELLNSDPWGQGWLIVVEMSDPGELDQLMDADAYSEMVAES